MNTPPPFEGNSCGSHWTGLDEACSCQQNKPQKKKKKNENKMKLILL
jgi:hypothetical protein